MSNPHEPVFEVRDPVYGFVKLTESEWKIVNCPEFQRLRDIRQLAMGYMVYPGANHTRFEHSIGCLHLSTLMFDALMEDEHSKNVLSSEFNLPRQTRERARQLLRLAALLHDIGHAPFSHTGEKLMLFDHEAMSAKIIRETEIAKAIGDGFETCGIGIKEVVAIATKPSPENVFNPLPYHTFLHELLTGELGSDRIDYLLRDAYHSGQAAGEFDYRRLIGSLTMVPPPKQEGAAFRLGLDSGGWLIAEQMIVARYLMYQSLYFHKTSRIYEKHLEEFMGEWLEQERGEPKLPGDVREYLKFSDSDVIAGLHQAAGEKELPGHLHARRFRDRSHMRLAKEMILADNIDPNRRGRRLPCKKRFAKLKEYVSDTLRKDVVRFDEPDHSATKMFGDTNKILVLLDEKPRYLDDISEIVRGMSEKIWRGRIYVEPTDRERVKDLCDKWLEKHPIDEFSEQEPDHVST